MGERGLILETRIWCIFAYLEMLMICLLFLKSWNTKFQSWPNSRHASCGKSDKSVSALERWNFPENDSCHLLTDLVISSGEQMVN